MGCLDLCQPEEPEGLPRVMPDPYTYNQKPWEMERAAQKEPSFGGDLSVSTVN